MLPQEKRHWAFIERERTAQFQDLMDGVSLLFPPALSTPDTPSTPTTKATPIPKLTAAAMVQMYLLEQGKHGSPLARVTWEPERHGPLLAMAAACLEMIDSSEMDCFWIFSTLAQLRHLELAKSSAILLPAVQVERLWSLLESHDPELHRLLHDHLHIDLRALAEGWFASCFASVIHSDALESVWDIWIGGGVQIFAYLALAILLAIKPHLLQARGDRARIRHIITTFPRHIDADTVAYNSIKLWEKPVLSNMSKENIKLLGYSYTGCSWV